MSTPLLISISALHLEKQRDKPVHISMQATYCCSFCFGRQDCLRPAAGKKGGFFRLPVVKAITSKVRAGTENHVGAGSAGA